MTIVKKIDNVWTRVTDVVQLTQLISTAEVHYHDGRQREISVADLGEEPYEVGMAPMSVGAIETLFLAGTWTQDDLDKYGLRYAAPFVAPEGKRIVGEPSYEEVEGEIVETYEVEDIPPPTPEDIPLNRIQFLFMLRKAGLEQAVAQALASMPEETDEQQNAKIMAQVLFETGQEFYRGHELFTLLAPQIGLSPEQLDDLWLQASQV